VGRRNSIFELNLCQGMLEAARHYIVCQKLAR